MRNKQGDSESTFQRRKSLILLIMTVRYFLVLLDVTLINVTLPSIRTTLGADVGTLQWIVDGYAVALASLLLAGGTLGDLYGHKRIVLAGFAIFGAASLICGIAPVSGVLIGARVVQGMGVAVLLPGTLAIISRAYQGIAALRHERSASGPLSGALPFLPDSTRRSARRNHGVARRVSHQPACGRSRNSRKHLDVA